MALVYKTSQDETGAMDICDMDLSHLKPTKKGTKFIFMYEGKQVRIKCDTSKAEAVTKMKELDAIMLKFK